MAAPCPLLGDGITDDTLLNVARFLPTARDLFCLGLTNTRFSIHVKCITAPSGDGGAAAAPAPEMLSLVEEAARLWVAGCSEQERGWVHRRKFECWLGLMHEVALLRMPLLFGRAYRSSYVHRVALSEGGAVATRVGGGSFRAAASKVVIRSGRHFAQFTTLVEDIDMLFGAIRPGWDVEGGEYAEAADGHCFYDTAAGCRFPGNGDWEGNQDAVDGDRIGMLLDLDQGSMTVWKNDTKLGVMQAEGLSGPLCWAAELCDDGGRGRIESAPAPASPTEEEMAVATAWHRRDELRLPQPRRRLTPSARRWKQAADY